MPDNWDKTPGKLSYLELHIHHLGFPEGINEE